MAAFDTPPIDMPDARRTSSLADFGLLLLRFAAGATMIQAGLIKALDFDTTVAFMESGGWRMPKFAAIIGHRRRDRGRDRAAGPWFADTDRSVRGRSPR